MPRCVGWCGSCYEGAKGRAFRRGHFGYRRPRGVVGGIVVPFELRRRATAEEAIVLAQPGPCPIMASRSALSMMMFEPRFVDGSARQTSTLLLCAHEGLVKACLRDRDSESQCWVSAKSVAEVLDLLEAGLCAGSLDWRAEGKKKKR